MKKVSIIVPVYNTERYLQQCLSSLVSQKLDDIEIIIVNDGSTDNSLSILNDYKEKYKDKIILIDSINQGAGKARNLGLLHATGEYIWFVDSDDWLAEDAVLKMYDIAKYYGVSMVTCDFQRCIGNIKKPSKNNHDSSLINLENEKDSIIDAKPAIGNKLMKRSLIGNVKMPNLKWEDLSFTYALVADSRKWYHLTERIYNYRATLNNTTTKDILNPTPRIVEIFDVLNILEGHFKERGLFDEYSNQFKKIYTTNVLRRVADVITWQGISASKKKIIINDLVNIMEIKYNDIIIKNAINDKLLFNPVSTYFLRNFATKLLDENMRKASCEEQIKEDIVKILK